jgi:hypothetical protein
VQSIQLSRWMTVDLHDLDRGVVDDGVPGAEGEP